MSKDTSFHEHFRIQDIKYNRTGEDNACLWYKVSHKRAWRKPRRWQGAPEKVEEDVGGAYFDDAFEDSEAMREKM